MTLNPYEMFWSHFENRARTWRDGGPMVAALDRMSPKDIDRTLKQLLARIHAETAPDPWVIQALGHLRIRGAAPKIRQALRSSNAVCVAHAALALWQIGHDQGSIPILIAVLDRTSHCTEAVEWGRIVAAVALGETAQEGARTALAIAANDQDSFVRHAAKVAIRRLAGR